MGREKNFGDTQQQTRNQKASLANLPSFLERTQDVIYRYDIKLGEFLFFNKVGPEVFGIRRDEWQTGPVKTVSPYIHPEDRKKVAQAARESMEPGRKGGQIEYRLLRPDGSIHWLHDRWIVIRDRSGEPVAIEGIVRDETRRKQAEEALRNRLKYEKMLSTISSEAVLTDEISRFFEKCLEVMGKTLDVSRIHVFRHCHKTDSMDNIFEWVAPGISRWQKDLQGIGSATILWEMEILKKNLVVNCPNTEAVPGERECALLGSNRIKSFLAVPIFNHQDYYGFIVFADCRQHREWYAEDVEILKTVAQIIAGVVERDLFLTTLQSERQQLLSIFGSIDQVIYIADLESYEILYANDACHKMLKKDKLVGKICYEEFQGRTSPCGFCTNDIIFTGKYAPYQWEFHNPVVDRDYMVIDRVIKWIDGRDVRFEFALDITDRKRAEEALRESEQNYRMVAYATSDVIFQFHIQEERFIYLSPNFEKVSGYTVEEAMDTPGLYLDIMLEEDFRIVKKQIAAAFKGTGDKMRLRYRVRCKNGDIKHISESSTLIRGEDGRVQRTIGALKDVTEAQHLEEKLNQAQKMQAMGTLAGGIAHDFNNILSAIIGNAEIARYSLEEPDQVGYSIDQILKASERAKDLVKQILAFSRQDEQKLKPIKVSAVVQESLGLLRASLPATIAIEQNITADRDTILADPTQIHQVLINLCANAQHAMGERGGVLEVGVSTLDLESREAEGYPDLPQGDYVNLTVSDTGFGMRPDMVERIFDPYFTTKEKGVGTGLGLAVVHGIVQRLEGSISVTTEPGKGSVFSILLPLTDRGSLMEAPAAALMPGGRERILMVDDEQFIADLGKRMLHQLGYRVATRTSSREALKAFAAQPDKFDLVITDMTMPQMTGDQLAKEIMGIRPDIPIILCTGFSETMTAEKAMAMGICGFIMKPILMQELAHTIRKVLEK